MEEDLHLQGSLSLRTVMMPGIVPRKRGFDRKDSNNAWDCSRKSGFHIVSNTAMSFHSSIDLVGFFPICYVRFFTIESIVVPHIKLRGQYRIVVSHNAFNGEQNAHLRVERNGNPFRVGGIHSRLQQMFQEGLFL